MTHGSLFSGIGGFDLAAEWMGWENKFHCEWNPFGQKVLKYYWPEAESFEDITKTDFTKYANTIDILTGGFPCQPYSLAGKRKGKDDDRHLWPEMLRCIGEVKPRWVVGENVRGLLNWNGGMVFDEVCTDLENLGYKVTAYLIPAASVNAPHKRERIWIVAFNSKSNRNSKIGGICKRTHNESIGICNKNINGTFTNSDNNGLNERNGTNEINTSERGVNAFGDISESNGNGNASDTEHKGLEGQCWEWQRCSIDRSNERIFIGSENKFTFANTNGIGLRRQGNRIGKSGFAGKNEPGNYWETFPTVSPICDGNDGISDRLDSITFSKWRNESIKAGGNAIVPQVAFQIFKTIEQYERIH